MRRSFVKNTEYMLALAWILFVLLCVIAGEWGLAWDIGWPIFVITIPTLIFLLWANSKPKKERLGIKYSSEGKEKANRIVSRFKWHRAGSAQTDYPYYVCYRYNCGNVADFDWLVKYLSVEGAKDKCGNSYRILKGSKYSCMSANRDFTVTQITREPFTDEERKALADGVISEPRTIVSGSLDASMFTSDFIRSFGENVQKNLAKVREQERNDPMVKLTKEMLRQRREELKEKIEELSEKKEEYRALRDEINGGINRGLSQESQYSRMSVAEYRERLEDYRERLVDLKDEIDDLECEIEDLRNEIDDLKDDLRDIYDEL